MLTFKIQPFLQLNLPKLFEWFGADFGKTKERMIKTVFVYLDDPNHKEAPVGYDVAWKEFDVRTMEPSQLVNSALSQFNLKH